MVKTISQDRGTTDINILEGKHKIHEETQDALKTTNTDMWKVPYFKYIFSFVVRLIYKLIH
jgi:hypothetical protein